MLLVQRLHPLLGRNARGFRRDALGEYTLRVCRTADRPQWGVRDNGDGAQLGVSLARARALVAPPSLCIFHTAIFRRRMVLARVQDWASSAADQSPLMGGPRVGATSNPLPGFERRVPRIYLSIGPRYLH